MEDENSISRGIGAQGNHGRVKDLRTFMTYESAKIRPSDTNTPPNYLVILIYLRILLCFMFLRTYNTYALVSQVMLML